jgi:sec-independent protein translocase protein TatA
VGLAVCLFVTKDFYSKAKLYYAVKIKESFMGMPGGWEWVVILLVVVVLFGGKKIPELAKGLGKGIKNFKDEMKDVSSDSDEEPLKKVESEKSSSSETTSTDTTKQA